MDISKQWVARAGALLVLLGFVLPTLTVSCAGMPGMGRSFSLASLASQANQPWLYLVPIGMIAALVFSFLPTSSATQTRTYLIAQLLSGVLSLLSFVATYLSISSQLNAMMGFDISPEIGSFLLIGGYLLLLVGIGLQWNQKNYISSPPQLSSQQINDRAIPPPDLPGENSAQLSQAAPIATSLARLEVLAGGSIEPVIPVTVEVFTIGRSKENSLQLMGADVSRHHARIRESQGIWFLQDQGSTGGTFVNGQPIEAIRINTGDKIDIGSHTLRFMC